jgi:hypothetical protein
MAKTPKRPRDPNQLAKAIVDIATGDLAESPAEGASSDMATLGRSGGLKGGQMRAEKLSPERRSEIAHRAAAARWGKRNGHDKV